jgi:hypothetical protein
MACYATIFRGHVTILFRQNGLWAVAIAYKQVHTILCTGTLQVYEDSSRTFH